MKILKLNCRTVGNTVSKQVIYNVIFDEIPELSYEKIGSDYVGTVVNDDGKVIFSEHLQYHSLGNAFAGREFEIKMKSGEYTKIKDHWFDNGSYLEHGNFISIGASTLKQLQSCYVYFSYNINEEAFQEMLDDYYTREKEYTYYEIQEWCNLQHKWYDVVIGGKKYPYLVNIRGNFIEKYTKKAIHPRKNILIWRYKDKSFNLQLFDFKYVENGRLIRIQRKLMEVLKESLPFSEEDIKLNCKLL